MEYPRSQRRGAPWCWQIQCRIQETLHFLLGVQVRPGARRSVRQEVDWWNLGSCVGGAAIASEAAHEAKAPGQILLQGFTQCVHRAPPGHGRASERSEPISARA